MKWKDFGLRLRALLFRRRMDEELQEELQFHIEMQARKNQRNGPDTAEAKRLARLQFGSVVRAAEECREVRGISSIEILAKDLHFALRMLSKSPGFTAVALLTMALGIGANTAIFSIVNGILLLPLPYANPSRLVATTSDYPKGAFVVMRDGSQSMDFAANTDSTELNLTGLNSPERLIGSAVSANWFSVLGVHPKVGRTFHPGEDQPGKDGVVILSYSLWQRRFGSDPNIVGRTIELEGQSREIVGAMPPNFTYPSPKIELWIPLHLDPSKPGDYWGASYMSVLARLRPRVSLERARGICSASPEGRGRFCLAHAG
ncbi:MAG: ABC transporter permease [Acidobacteria bacterium Pan2503]|uniref:ABC transporter permease n=1 Tax=Candidatus Acidiferrum panamense TaxID=2741543 RepID=A0A7V8NSV5_9BACT|nr:ABC transporter permease [Candidatus Acidoferrum panamensis]